MRTFCYLLMIFSAAAAEARAEVAEWVESASTDGLRFRIYFASPLDPPALYSHEPFAFSLVAEPGKVPKAAWLLRQEYGYKVTLTDAFGNTVTDSHARSPLGKRFEEAPFTELSQSDFHRYVRMNRSGPITARAEGSAPVHLPSVNEWFQLSQSGDYVLSFEAKFAVKGESDRWRIVRVGPVRLRIVHLHSQTITTDKRNLIAIAVLALAVFVVTIVTFLLVRPPKRDALNSA